MANVFSANFSILLIAYHAKLLCLFVKLAILPTNAILVSQVVLSFLLTKISVYAHLGIFWIRRHIYVMHVSTMIVWLAAVTAVVYHAVQLMIIGFLTKVKEDVYRCQATLRQMFRSARNVQQDVVHVDQSLLVLLVSQGFTTTKQLQSVINALLIATLAHTMEAVSVVILRSISVR